MEPSFRIGCGCLLPPVGYGDDESLWSTETSNGQLAISGFLTLGVWIATRSLLGEIAVNRLAKDLACTDVHYINRVADWEEEFSDLVDFSRSQFVFRADPTCDRQHGPRKWHAGGRCGYWDTASDLGDGVLRSSRAWPLMRAFNSPSAMRQTAEESFLRYASQKRHDASRIIP
jgi:hypothetical protein